MGKEQGSPDNPYKELIKVYRTSRTYSRCANFWFTRITGRVCDDLMKGPTFEV